MELELYKLPKVNRPVEQQQLLFEHFPEFDFKTVSAARTHYGKAMEQIVCAAFGLHPIPINGNYEINFDAFKGDYFFEIKSVRNGGKVVVYDWRMEKEKPYNDKLFYIFAAHTVKNAKTNRELFEKIEDTGIELIVQPASVVHELAYKQKQNFIKNKNQSGYSRGGYSQGYRNVPIKELKGNKYGGYSIVPIFDFAVLTWANRETIERQQQWNQ